MKNLFFCLIVFQVVFTIPFADPSMYELKGWSQGSDADWQDVVCGDFDGDGIDEWAII